MPGELFRTEYHWALMTDGGTARRRARPRRGPGNGGPSLARATPESTRLAATQALPLLEAAVRDLPDDLSAGDSLGYVLGVLRGPARRARRIRTDTPHPTGSRVDPLYSGSRCWASNGSIWLRAAMQKTIAVSPWCSDYRLGLARVCSQAGDWAGAAAACREAIRLDPELVEARSLLVQCYLQSHEPDRADAELQVLLRFYPASREAWQQWYEQQKHAGPAVRLTLEWPALNRESDDPLRLVSAVSLLA